MKGRGIYGLIVVFLMVLLVIFVYNRFLAKPGESVATLGKKQDAAAIAVAVGASLIAAKMIAAVAMFAAMVS